MSCEEAMLEDMVELIMSVVLQFCKDFVVHGMNVGLKFGCRQCTMLHEREQSATDKGLLVVANLSDGAEGV